MIRTPLAPVNYLATRQPRLTTYFDKYPCAGASGWAPCPGQHSRTIGKLAMSASMVKIETNFGDISLELDNENAPKTVANFLSYVEDGFYNGTIFHRVIDGFMIQGGGLDQDMKQKSTNDAIKNEANNGLSNAIGTVAMARTGDPHSATAQFFINVADNTFLDHKDESEQGWGYCVFGKVVDGMDTVNKIKSVETTLKSHMRDVPAETVEIKSATVIIES